MLLSVLNSRRAVQMSILIIRAFVNLREMLATHKDLARKIEDLERQQKKHIVVFVVLAVQKTPIPENSRPIVAIDRRRTVSGKAAD
jgi:hypothetical protein